MADLLAHPVEPIVVLTHNVAKDGRRKPCGKVAMHATTSYLQQVADGHIALVCQGCFRKEPLTLDEVTGDEPIVPEYRHKGAA